jgi:putative transposase
MCHTKNCYEICINKDFLISKKLWNNIKEIISELSLNAKTGRPRLEAKRALNGIYYLLKTGIHWKAIPRCFGSTSAIHRFFQKLVSLNFFQILWSYELKNYDKIHGLNLSKQAMDCSHRKSPIGCEKSGKSPVDRRKLGSKISVASESKGIIIGLALGSANQHDSTLFVETLLSIPKFLEQPAYKEMNLDSAYDSELVRTALFNLYYIPKISPNQRRKKIRPTNPIGYSRWFIEPVHAWMNKFRAIFVRYSKSAKNYLAYAQFAAAIITFNKI